MTVTRVGFRFCIGESMHHTQAPLVTPEFCRPHLCLGALALTYVLKHM